MTGRAPDFPLQAVITEPGIDAVANLNPLGTLMTSIAGELDGGLTAANLEAARDIVMGSFGFGFDALDEDAITDNAEAFYLMRQRGIENVIVMGVHTNMDHFSSSHDSTSIQYELQCNSYWAISLKIATPVSSIF